MIQDKKLSLELEAYRQALRDEILNKPDFMKPGFDIFETKNDKPFEEKG